MEKGRLPVYFHEKGLDALFPAFALLDHFSTGQQPHHPSDERDFTGIFQGKTTKEEVRSRRLRLEKFPHQSFYEVEEHALYQTESVPKEIETSGWGIIPSCDGLLIFLQGKDEQTVSHRLYVAHSMNFPTGSAQRTNRVILSRSRIYC